MSTKKIKGVPFLLIEPVKTEYRSLKTLKNHPDEQLRALARDLQIYTFKEGISPLRINPLKRIEGIDLYEHIDNVFSCIKASFPMEGPLPGLIGEALEQVYEDSPDPSNPPIIADLISAFNNILKQKEYSGEVMSNLLGAGEVRLGSLIRRTTGKVFQCKTNIPDIDQLLNSATIFELDGLPPEQLCLIVLFTLTLIRERIQTLPWKGKGIRFVIILEEAHNIVGRNTDTSSQESAVNPKAHAASYICRMLAELRALGVPIIIADQSPSTVAAEVIKATGLKIAFRQVEYHDRQELGHSMLFVPTELEEIARCMPGQGYYFSEGMHRSCKIRTLNLHEKTKMDTVPLNEAILPSIQEEMWFQQAKQTRINAELLLFDQKVREFDAKRVQLTLDFARVIKKSLQIMPLKNASQKVNQLNLLRINASKIKRKLETSFRNFVQLSYRPLVGWHNVLSPTETYMQKEREQFIHYFITVIKPDTEACIQKINHFIDQCNN